MRFIERTRRWWAPLGVLSALAACAPLPRSPAPIARAPTSPAAAPPPAESPADLPGSTARNWAEYRQQFARRLVAANPDGTYLGVVVEPLLAIPVLEIEFHADGSVRRIQVKRKPGQALDTIDLAIAAVQRAGPFPSVRHLPRPWAISEVFLFNAERKFKPRELDH